MSIRATYTTDAMHPFDLESSAAYRVWREHKLAQLPLQTSASVVDIADIFCLKESERSTILQRLSQANAVIYRLRVADPGKQGVRQLGRQLGLQRLDKNLCADGDGITSLQVVEKRREGEYIPYTNKRLNWHTDGYYNHTDEQIHGVILHCVRPAQSGGENTFMDHELAYILLRDQNPDHIRALMAGDAMIIPANVQKGREIRSQQAGPVFSVGADGHLHMRYSARTRNIIWKADATTQAAAECLLNLFQVDSPYIFRHRLQAGQGVISNNALHCRTEFNHSSGDAKGRLLYRARYFDRVTDVNLKG